VEVEDLVSLCSFEQSVRFDAATPAIDARTNIASFGKYQR